MVDSNLDLEELFMDKDIPKAEDLSFEEALKSLEAIVKTLEDGSASLEQAVTLYEQGVGLKKRCEEKLKDATLKVEQILVSEPDEISTRPFLETPS